MQIKRIVQFFALSASTIALATSPKVFYVNPSQISGGYTFSNPGTYVLTDDAIVTSSISLSADVIFDLNGKTLTADSTFTPATALVLLNGNNTAVKNGLLDGGNPTSYAMFGVETAGGIINASVSGVTVVNVSTNNKSIGIFVSGSGSTGVRIDACEVINSFSGLVVGNTDSCWVTNTECSFNMADGFDFGRAGGSTGRCFVSNCVANGNIAIGFNILFNSIVSVKNCSAEDNSSWGFQLSAANTTSQFRGNIAYGNGGTGADKNYSGSIGFIAVSNTSVIPENETLNLGFNNISIT